MEQRLTQVGALGATPIFADATYLSPAGPVAVLLSANYTLLFPPGWPTRPSYDGAEVSKIVNPIPSGVTFKFLKPEADAIVTAGGGSYA